MMMVTTFPAICPPSTQSSDARWL